MLVHHWGAEHGAYSLAELNVLVRRRPPPLPRFALHQEYAAWFKEEWLRPSLQVDYGAETGNVHDLDEREGRWVGRGWNRKAPLYIEHNVGRVEHLINAVMAAKGELEWQPLSLTPTKLGQPYEPRDWQATFGPKGTLAPYLYLASPALRVLGAANIARFLTGRRGKRISESGLGRQFREDPAYSAAINKIGWLYVSNVFALRALDLHRQAAASASGKQAGLASTRARFG